jgi:hypothetical protein
MKNDEFQIGIRMGVAFNAGGVSLDAGAGEVV